MRAVIEVECDDGGRLVGELDCTGRGRRPFTGLMELVGLIEDGLEADRVDPPPPAGPQGTASDSTDGGRPAPGCEEG